MDITAGDYRLTNVTSVNVILGKNGCGKSTLLKQVESQLRGDRVGRRKYITPERGGVLEYQANVEQNLSANPQWITESRRVNQFVQFREQSVVQFRRLELLVLRECEAKGEVANFGPYIERLNALLDNVEMRRADPTFKIFSRTTGQGDGQELPPGIISSGEAELISLGIEVLMFCKEIEPDKDNYIFLDEPDVHLHPDLQGRLVKFLTDLVDEYRFTVLIATHSTAILGGLADYEGASVAFMQPREKEMAFERIGPIHKRVLPVFGAHPLSNIFNEAPVLIVEGEDDERVWQQAVRSSDGAVCVYPVACEGVTSMSDYEREVRRIIGAVYENARAYSLRDRDGAEGGIADEAPIVRMKLDCRAAENLILTDEVLSACQLNWQEAVDRMNAWIGANTAHLRHGEMIAFRDGGYDRMGWDLKDLRMLVVGVILNSTKSWEVLVGQAIGRLQPHTGAARPSGSIESFLGEKAATHLLRGAAAGASVA